MDLIIFSYYYNLLVLIMPLVDAVVDINVLQESLLLNVDICYERYALNYDKVYSWFLDADVTESGIFSVVVAGSAVMLIDGLMDLIKGNAHHYFLTKIATSLTKNPSRKKNLEGKLIKDFQEKAHLEIE